MSATREVTIWCDGGVDGSTCGVWYQAGGETARSVRETRAEAKRSGWRYGRGKDLCPVCSGNESEVEGRGSFVIEGIPERGQ